MKTLAGICITLLCILLAVLAISEPARLILPEWLQ